MNTRLTFEAPADLSVGRITVQNESRTVGEWVATPGEKTLSLDNAEPGIYTAQIAPVGVRPQSFVFEVKEGIENTVTAPLFSVLIAGGNTAAFAGVDDRQSAFDSLVRTAWRENQETLAPTPKQDTGLVRSAFVASTSPKAASAAKLLSIGLSEADPPDGNEWRPYSGGDPTVQFENGGLNVLVSAAETSDRTRRLRLSAAVEKLRIESFLVPLFRGGTQIAFRPSALTTIDLAIRVMPVDPERRALVRALQGGEREEAEAVQKDVLRGGISRFLDGPDEDPWAAMVAALLAIRFPDVFGPKPLDWGPWVVDRYNWAADAHIINAHRHLALAPQDAAGQIDAVHTALDTLRFAQDRGPPYFAYSSQLMCEMLTGLAAVREQYPDLADRAEQQLQEWRRYLPLQRSGGVVFSWETSDLRSGRKSGKAAFHRNIRGNLDERLTRVFFRGQLDLARMSLLPSSATPGPPKAADIEGPEPPASIEPISLSSTLDVSPSSSLPEAPALQRPVLFPDDPNKGRFGGAAMLDGYALSATFAETKQRDWVEIRLVVNAERSLPPNFSDAVEFFLHPTFNPSRLTTTFRGHTASLTVRAWGGFTVGAWLPASGVELECDLAALPDAPRIIREL